MRFLLAAYCVVTPSGQVQIGAYKRALRLGLRLLERGHEVALYCGGREHHHDELTRRAEGRMTFMDTGVPGSEGNRVRALLRAQMAAFRPDRVVICDAPLGGPLMEATLCAVEDGIPTVIIDNLYNPNFPLYYCGVHGAVADGILLTGLSCCYTPYGPPYLGQVPPMIDLDLEGADAFLGPRSGPLMTVLAYDPRALSLGLALAEALQVETLVLGGGPVTAGGSVRVATPPDDAVLAGILQRSDLVVGKCGFMQLTECLALGTPFVGLAYESYYDPFDLPAPCREMLHITSSVEAGPETVAAARRLLSGEFSLSGVHDGGSDGLGKAVDYLEALPSSPRPDCTADAASHGFTAGRLLWALGELGPVEMVRCTMVRNESPRCLIYTVTCRVAGKSHRLWGKRFADVELLRAGAAAGGRRVRGVWEEDLVLLEEDLEFHNLPSLGLVEQ